MPKKLHEKQLKLAKTQPILSFVACSLAPIGDTASATHLPMKKSAHILQHLRNTDIMQMKCTNAT